MVILNFMVLSLMIVESPFRTTTPLYMITFLLSVFYNVEGKVTKY